MRIRLPQNWKVLQADSWMIVLTNSNYPNSQLIWEYNTDGFNWYIQKIENGRLISGIITRYKNFSHAIKEC